jgi:hypothetical protein
MRSIVLSMSGSGHLLCYQIGVAKTVLSSATWGSRIQHFAGASGGAIAATACALLPLPRVAEFAEAAIEGGGLNVLSEILLGPRSSDLQDSVDKVTAEQRLFLSATVCRTGRSALFSRFRSPADLQRCVLASATIPRGMHPFDLLRSRPTYPEASGVVIDPLCEWDGGSTARCDVPSGLPFSPHGEAYVDGGITDTAPRLPEELGVHALTVSPVAGPQGRLTAPDASVEHFHLTPLDASFRLPFVAPSLAGMRVYCSRDNLHALGDATRGGAQRLKDWYRRGQEDAHRFLDAFPEPPAT